MQQIVAGVLDIAYEDSGPADGTPVLLLHGFPYDVHAYRATAIELAGQGYRCIVPYLRGFGPTRFLSATTPRSGQQAAVGADLLALMDALNLPCPVLAGYDWGGRAACIVAALWPQRVRGLVTADGYAIQDIAHSARPKPPAEEHRLWYQYYFHSDRGRAGLDTGRAEFCRLLWRLWSPSWNFTEAQFAASAAAFDNPDFVDVVIHSYRHRLGLAAGDPALAPIEDRLADQPPIAVPTIALTGADDGVGGKLSGREKFTAAFEARVVASAGHNLPQEAPGAFARAVLDVAAR